VIANARDVVSRLCRVKALLPVLLFGAFVVGSSGIGAAAEARSLLLTLACVAVVVAALVALAAWTLVTERSAKHTAELARPAEWHPRQWAEFERAFWSYVDGSWDAPPRAAE
jgi:hypothetical protein